MKGIIGALIAVAILWAVDSQLNNGRYTDAVRQAVQSITGIRI